MIIHRNNKIDWSLQWGHSGLVDSYEITVCVSFRYISSFKQLQLSILCSFTKFVPS